MKRIIIARLIGLIPVIVALMIVVFMIVHLIPGNPILVMLGRDADPITVEALTKEYGFDKPLWDQFYNWSLNVFQGDLGESLSYKQPVLTAILTRLPRTIMLVILGILLSLIISIPAGAISAIKKNKMTDFNISTVTLVLISIPSFWLGILLVIAFSVYIPLFPASGYNPMDEGLGAWFLSIIMPVFTIAAAIAASTTRLLRTSMLEVLNEDYVTLARTKGNPLRRVYYIHTLRNAINPIYTTVSMKIAYLLGGVVVIEKVFAFPGMGLLLLNGIESRDYPLIQGTILVFALMVVIVNMITDILYPLIDPRIRH